MADEGPGEESCLIATGKLPCTEPAFFQCGAVELAEYLLGKFLYLSESKIVVRIVETEAYPNGDEVYERKFYSDSLQNLHNAAGVVVPALPTSASGIQLFITAGDEEDSGDVVLLRSCVPIEGREMIIKRRYICEAGAPQTDTLRAVTPATRRDVIVGPNHVAQALGEEWKSCPLPSRRNSALSCIAS